MRPGRPRTNFPEARQCEHCRRIFEVVLYATSRANGIGRFCSRTCFLRSGIQRKKRRGMANFISAYKREVLHALLQLGYPTRAVARLADMSPHTATKYRKRATEDGADFRCPCGRPGDHRSWCAPRVAASPARQAFLKERWRRLDSVRPKRGPNARLSLWPMTAEEALAVLISTPAPKIETPDRPVLSDERLKQLEVMAEQDAPRVQAHLRLARMERDKQVRERMEEREWQRARTEMQRVLDFLNDPNPEASDSRRMGSTRRKTSRM